MARIKGVEKLVYMALVEKPETRGDDCLLILEVLSNFVTPHLTLEAVFKHHVELGIPSIETITRCRRKLQKEHPELVDPAAKEIRKEEEQEFRDYALNN